MHQERPISQLRPATIWIVGLNLLALVGVVWVLTEARTVIAWLILSLFFALAIEPLLRWLSRHGVRRGWGILSVVVGLLGTSYRSASPLLC